MRTVKVGLIGLGTVGSGVVEIFRRHREDFQRRAGVDVELVRFADRSTERFADLGLPPEQCTTDAAELIADPDVDIVIELIGGTGAARDIVLDALNAGKSVVTANKALMASARPGGHGRGAAAAAWTSRSRRPWAAASPSSARSSTRSSATRSSSVMGIVNGTTNYMLTRMAEDGLDYDDALAEAQARGFAEADPTADVDGLDAAAKIAILASIAFNSPRHRSTRCRTRASGTSPPRTSRTPPRWATRSSCSPSRNRTRRRHRRARASRR